MTGAAGASATRLDEFALSADGAGARRAAAWLEAACRARDVPGEQAERLLLGLEEVLANVMAHGGDAARSSPITLRLEVRRDGEGHRACVTVSDAGMPFDPLSVPARALPKSLEEASTRGMGLQLLRRCADLLHYRHHEGRNQLTFGTRWSVP